MQCRSSKEKIQPVTEFSYSLTGVSCLFFCLFFVYNFLQLYKDIRVLQGNLQPVNKNFGAMTFQLKSALYLPHLKSFELMHFRRRLRCIAFPTSTKMHRLSVLQRVRDIETSHSLMSLHGRILA